MSKNIVANPYLTQKVRFQTDEREYRNADICNDMDNVTVCDNYLAEGSTLPKLQDNNSEDQGQSICLTACLLCDTYYN